jgi:nucleoside-diphosphate-sugar epimerase
MKRVLVTGAAGFIGKNVLPLLAKKEFEIHAVDINPIKTVSESIYWHKVNLMNSSEIDNLMKKVQPSHLLHLAWFVTPGKWALAPENYDWVQISLDLVKKFSEHGGTRCVVAGSGLEYDWDYGYCNELLTPKKPATFYGVCKNSLHEVVAKYAEITGLSFAWGRLFFLYGPKENPNRLVAHVIKSLLQDEEAKCSHGEQVRDFLHVHDAADALVNLLESDFKGDVNIASGIPIKLKEIISMIGQKTNKQDLIKLGAIPPAPSDTNLVVADTTRLNNELNWKPKFDLDKGLEDTIEWWKNHLKGEE